MLVWASSSSTAIQFKFGSVPVFHKISQSLAFQGTCIRKCTFYVPTKGTYIPQTGLESHVTVRSVWWSTKVCIFKKSDTARWLQVRPRIYNERDRMASPLSVRRRIRSNNTRATCLFATTCTCYYRARCPCYGPGDIGCPNNARRLRS